jgi:hypothetical protein
VDLGGELNAQLASATNKPTTKMMIDLPLLIILKTLQHRRKHHPDATQNALGSSSHMVPSGSQRNSVRKTTHVEFASITVSPEVTLELASSEETT